MSAKKKITAVIGGSLLAVGLSVAAAAPASAAPSNCPSGSTCMWRDANYITNGAGSDYVGFQNGIYNFSGYYWSVGTPLGNNVTSMYNNGNSQESFLFYNTGFRTQAANFPLHTGLPNVTVANDLTWSAGFSFCVNNPNSSLCV